jgi:UDP-N-acetylglucosamine acyltransferase
MSVNVDHSARVNPKAQLDDGVSIGPFSIVEDDVIIGANTRVGSNVFIASGARVGKNCHLHHGAVVSTIPQDLRFEGERSQLEIGDGTVIREFVTLNRGTKGRLKTSIGANCLLMAYVHVAHDCIIGNGVILANSVNLGGYVTIEDHAFVGGIVGIHQFVQIGCYVMVGAVARVMKDVPPYIVAAGEPLSFEGLNIVGLRRRAFPPESIASIDKAYHYIYQSNMNVSQGIKKIKEEMVLTDEVKHIVEFIEKSKRGIVGMRRRLSST